MAKRTRKTKKRVDSRPRRWARALRRWLWRGVFGAAAVMLVWIILYAFVPVPTTIYMMQERARIGTALERDWVPMEEISPHLARAAVAAEDANFCLHWGFDMSAIRDAIADGAARGGSTISQQTVKNAFLWHGRSWVRKALEAAITPVMELIWPKRRVLEVYLNVAEFAPGVFGAEAAAQHHFGISANAITQRQASLLAAVLPNPQQRNASAPSGSVDRRARSIASGAATIRADGRDDCFAN
ncbi:monofunctional biosynthetic peptidoglycan transglycosylase [Gymnodinialimonas ulvae]|uniref:monofunctional biosynthetic peptidoglycan transglycosylase n=1 Tax=Gymnodinialimonas ulvae TaxID=3126504 RepID=UPI0030B1FAE2